MAQWYPEKTSVDSLTPTILNSLLNVQRTMVNDTILLIFFLKTGLSTEFKQIHSQTQKGLRSFWH